jgi:hypothetical protein
MTFRQYLEQKRFSAATVKAMRPILQTFTDWLETEQLAPGAFTYNELIGLYPSPAEKGKSKKAIQSPAGHRSALLQLPDQESQREDNPAAGCSSKGSCGSCRQPVKLGGNGGTVPAYSIQLNVDPGEARSCWAC